MGRRSAPLWVAEVKTGSEERTVTNAERDDNYQEVQDSIQHGMDMLARRRRFPLLG